jgi:hypothetical protein
LEGQLNHALFDIADIWAVRTGNELTVVSANDHVHSRNSAHYEDRALDWHGTDLAGLAEWLDGHGLLVYWQVPGHYAHVHAEWRVHDIVNME